jgi:hypothetical protein
MNILKNMEAVFVVTAVTLVYASAWAKPVAPHTTPVVAAEKIATVVITGKRLTPAQKLQLR